MDRHVILVFTEPAEGREEEYNAVYTAHVPEVVAVKGVVAGRRFRWSDPERTDGPPQRYLAIYELEGDLETVRAALVADGHPAQLPDSYGPTNTDWWFTAISEPVRNPDAGSLSDRHVILVFTEPTEDREDEYNSFYSEIQVPEVVTTKGVVSGQRFRLGYTGTIRWPPTSLPRYVRARRRSRHDARRNSRPTTRRALRYPERRFGSTRPGGSRQSLSASRPHTPSSQDVKYRSRKPRQICPNLVVRDQRWCKSSSCSMSRRLSTWRAACREWGRILPSRSAEREPLRVLTMITSLNAPELLRKSPQSS